jgi:hypothetical protein
MTQTTIPAAWVTPERTPRAAKPAAAAAVAKVTPPKKTAAKVASPKKRTAVPAEPERELPTWFPEFEMFLTSVPHGSISKVASPSNAKSVLRQVKKLVTGEGIGYIQWPRNIIFAEHRVVTLDDDFHVLLLEAKHYEDTYGRDTGNGWLVRHPLKKLLLFQSYQQHLQQQRCDES